MISAMDNLSTILFFHQMLIDAKYVAHTCNSRRGEAEGKRVAVSSKTTWASLNIGRTCLKKQTKTEQNKMLLDILSAIF